MAYRLNPDLGEFISTIYKRSFAPQKNQAVKLAKQLLSLENYTTEGEILTDAKDVLVGLSYAMRKKEQFVLNEPKIQGTASSSVPELDKRAISLSLITLVATSARPDQTGYETHIRGEALFAAGLVRLLQIAAPDETIFVATPHRVQRQAVKDALISSVDDLAAALGSLNIGDIGNSQQSGKKEKVVVDTVERLQGQPHIAFWLPLLIHCLQ